MKRLNVCFALCAAVCLSELFAWEAVGALELTDIAVTARPECSIGGAFDGERYMMGLQLDGQNIAVQFVSASGLPDGNPIPVPGSTGMPPAVAFGSNVYLMAWVGFDGSVNGQIVSPTGVLQGSSFILSPSGSAQVDIGTCHAAYGGERFLVAWEDVHLTDVDPDPEPDDEDTDVFGQLINPDGTLFLNNLQISGSGDGDDGHLSIGFDGRNFLVVYSSETRANIYDGEDVYGRFISPVSGLAGPSFVIDQNDVPSCNPTETVFADDRYAVLFHESLAATDAESWQIYARFVSTNGVVSADRIYIAGNEAMAAQFPFMGWNGTNYLIALRESMPEHWTDGDEGDEADFIDTNGVIRARWFDDAMQPASAWIDVTGGFGDNEAVLAAMVLPAHNGFALGIQTIETNWVPVNVYGAYVDDSTIELAGIGDNFNDNSKDSEKWGDDFYFGPNTAAVLNEANGRLELTKPAGLDSEGVIRPWIQTVGSYTQNWEVAIDVHLGNIMLPEGDDSWINMNLAVSRLNDTSLIHAVPISLDLYRDGASLSRGYEMSPMYNGMEVKSGPGYGYLSTGDQTGTLRLRFDAASKVISGYCNETLLSQVDVDDPTSNWGMGDDDLFGFALVGSTGSESLAIASGDAYADNFEVVGSLPATPPSKFDSVCILRSLESDGPAMFEVDVSAPAGKTITVAVPTEPATLYTLTEDDNGEYEYFDPTMMTDPMATLDTRYPQGDYVLRLYADPAKTTLEETLVVSFSDGSGGALPFPEVFPLFIQPVPSGGEIRAVPNQTYTWQTYGGSTGSATHMDFEITGTGEFDEDVAIYFTEIDGACSYTPSTVAAGTYDVELCFLFLQSEQTAGGTGIECANERYSRHLLTVAEESPDLDKNGLPDTWEQHYFGTTGLVPDAVCSNGISTFLEAYIAGIDPTDPDAWFGITGGNARNGTLSWNSVSGRVYSVWWSSDLMDDFQCIESNILWNAGGFTDTVQRVESTGFYKLEVRPAQ
ncbi:MAG: hypothetical protein JXR40_06175 [Pontiellaceae bacterium]|nr:hypothetical protein [Pontiellaceae bacterium]